MEVLVELEDSLTEILDKTGNNSDSDPTASEAYPLW